MPYSYVAEGESLRDVLVNFGANYEVSVVVSDKVNDQVNGQFEHDEPLAFFAAALLPLQPGLVLRR